MDIKCAKLQDVVPGMLVRLPGFKGTYPNGLIVARIYPARYKSYLSISFKGGRCYALSRFDEVEIINHQADTSG